MSGVAEFRVAWHLVGESEAEYLTLLAVPVVGGAGGVACLSSPVVVVVFCP